MIQMLLDEKIKKGLKIIGYVFLGLFLLGLYNLIFNGSKIKTASNDSSFLSEQSFDISSPMGLSERGISDNSREKMTSSFVEPEMMQQDISVSNDKKVIKTGYISMNVEDADESAEKIRKVAIDNGGDVFSSNFNERVKGVKNGNITVKIPNENFEKAFSEFKKIASHVVSESVSGQDVTEQFSDLEIQIRNKKAEEERFLAILNQAVKIEDVLAVTKEVSRTRREIESLEGRMKLLNNQVEMSTISIQISEDISLPVGGGWRPWEVVKNSFKELVGNIQGFVNNFINFLIVVLPTLVIYGIFVFILYKIGRKVYFKFLKK